MEISDNLKKNFKAYTFKDDSVYYGETAYLDEENNVHVDLDKLEDSKIKTPIIISNHSCWFDTFYITLKYSPVSYVAKYEVQFWPIIGACAKAMNCIFVKRQNENDRNVVKDLIK
jgi:1-acyl-sn-glycerol-3-phosphate acyltransferase